MLHSGRDLNSPPTSLNNSNASSFSYGNVDPFHDLASTSKPQSTSETRDKILCYMEHCWWSIRLSTSTPHRAGRGYFALIMNNEHSRPIVTHLAPTLRLRIFAKPTTRVYKLSFQLLPTLRLASLSSWHSSLLLVLILAGTMHQDVG